jgi:hypothetical protein
MLGIVLILLSLLYLIYWPQLDKKTWTVHYGTGDPAEERKTFSLFPKWLKKILKIE